MVPNCTYVGFVSVPRVPLSGNGSHPGHSLPWPMAEAQAAKPNWANTSKTSPHTTSTTFHGPTPTAPPDPPSGRQGWTLQSSVLTAGGRANHWGQCPVTTPAAASWNLHPGPNLHLVLSGDFGTPWESGAAPQIPREALLLSSRISC